MREEGFVFPEQLPGWMIAKIRKVFQSNQGNFRVAIEKRATGQPCELEIQASGTLNGQPACSRTNRGTA